MMASSRQLWYDSSAMKKKEETDDLLVFGYSCKLFRDDEKALYIDQGKHLIPWMGDESLKIDRYDVRGTVYDLRSLEPIAGGASEALWTSLSDAERKVEQLCDEERYRALYHNEAEEALYQEEELKRLHQALDPQNSYGQVAYSYDNEADEDKSTSLDNKDSSEQAEDEDEPFIPPQELDIPVGMVLPEKIKLNAIIEKTALFINTQGPQMEILLKMKQANNPQFSFLSYDCPLHAYYRHLLMAIKTGRYRPKRNQNLQEQDSEVSEHYLHPSLAAASSRVELAPNIPSISYKPSADCAYSMLVNKIKDKHLKAADDNHGDTLETRVSGRKGSQESDDSSNSTIGNDVSVKQTSSFCFPVPSGELQLIIDKMASYVIKNGRDFESVVRSKGDERFAFLEVGHEFHKYYEHKVRVYQGLEAPLSQKSVQLSVVKKKKDKVKSPVKKQPCILLPGYEYSDEDSESDEESQNISASGSKPKLAPVSFSIKKPKETEILKEVRSALPIEEESSEEEGDTDAQALKPPGTNSEADTKHPASAPDQGLAKCVPHMMSNPAEEMEKLQQMLKEKERQLRELERQKKLSEKRNQDSLPVETKEKHSDFVSVHSPSLEKVISDDRDSFEKHIKKENKKLDKFLKDTKSKEICDNSLKEISLEKRSDCEVLAKENLEDEVIAEAEIIDLTDDTNDVPKLSDTMRQERKRKAAAFLNFLKKDRLIRENGTVASDSDGSSKRSTPSPPHSTHLKKGQSYPNYNGASVPRTSLMARLTASSALRREQCVERKRGEDMTRGRESESPVKSTWERGKRACSSSSSSTRKHKKKRRGSSSDSEEPISHTLTRSRSIPYSRPSPHKRRSGEDCDSEHRVHRPVKEDRHKMAHRRKHSDMNETDVMTAHSHHKRHKESRHPHTFGHCYSKNVREAKVNSSDSSE